MDELFAKLSQSFGGKTTITQTTVTRHQDESDSDEEYDRLDVNYKRYDRKIDAGQEILAQLEGQILHYNGQLANLNIEMDRCVNCANQCSAARQEFKALEWLRKKRRLEERYNMLMRMRETVDQKINEKMKEMEVKKLNRLLVSASQDSQSAMQELNAKAIVQNVTAPSRLVSRDVNRAADLLMPEPDEETGDVDEALRAELASLKSGDTVDNGVNRNNVYVPDPFLDLPRAGPFNVTRTGPARIREEELVITNTINRKKQPLKAVEVPFF